MGHDIGYMQVQVNKTVSVFLAIGQKLNINEVSKYANMMIYSNNALIMS